MIDATGMPETAVLIGGTSDIGLATLQALAKRRLEAVVLAGRDTARLDKAAELLRSAGISKVHTERLDFGDRECVGSLDDLARSAAETLGGVDLLLVATGDLGTAEIASLDPSKAVAMFDANASGPAAATLAFTRVMTEAGSGRIVVLSSVAGVRVRKANFVYGAGKAAIDGFGLGLSDALDGSGVRVMVVRPGFVRTKMTAGMPAVPFSTDAVDVAAAIVRGLETGAPVVWVPAPLKYVFAGLRLLPRSVFKRLPG